MKERLLTLWSKTTPAERQQGAAWYHEAHKFADSLAFWCDLSIETTCGVIAALSPQLSWERNCEAAEQLLKGEPVRGVLVQSIKRANTILCGQRPGATAFPVSTAPKTNSFYHNLRNPADPRFVTIDRHAAAAALGKRVERFDYWPIDHAYKEAAATVGMTPCAFQATLWVCQRRGWQMPLF